MADPRDDLTRVCCLGDHSQFKTVLKFSSHGDVESEVFCVRFNQDDQYLAAACSNGQIHIYSTLLGKKSFTLSDGKDDRLPITQVRWRPSEAACNIRHVLVSVGADGKITHWQATSGNVLHEIVESENQINCLDYRIDGLEFATAGRRREVCVYDEETKKLRQLLMGGDSVNTPGHSNRVFALKYHPRDNNILITGGWDNTLQIWDLRSGFAVRAIYGPVICGDAIDVSSDGNTILTGSWRSDKQLQLWDFGSEKLMETLPWRTRMAMSQPCMLYAAQFSKGVGSPLIAAGGGGANEAKFFDRAAGGTVFGGVSNIGRPCYSVDFSHDGSMIAVGGGDGSVRVMSVVTAGSDDL